MQLDFMEAVEGTEKEVTFNANMACSTCDGSGAKPGTRAQTCRQCGGKGTETATNGFFAFSTTCRTCRGKGSTITTPCTACKGKGNVKGRRTVKVKIPPGVDKGTNIRLAGQGEPGESGGRPGNLYINLSVKDHELFKREGMDVHLDVPISIGQAILGATIRVPTLTGEAELKVPPGTQAEDKRVLRSKGIKQVHSSNSGHQYVHFKVIVPKHITAKQKELLEEFEKLGETETKNQEGFWRDAFKRWREYLSKQSTKASA